MSSADRPGRMNSSVGGCGGGEVEGVRSDAVVSRCSYRGTGRALPAVGGACLFGFATARGALSSESEAGSSIRCRLAGFGRAGWRAFVVALFSQGSVLAMTRNALGL